MGKKKQAPDTQFRKCQGGCNRKIWCERPTTCAECVAFFAWYFGAEREKASAVPPRSPYGAAYHRGLVMSRHMRQAGR